MKMHVRRQPRAAEKKQKPTGSNKSDTSFRLRNSEVDGTIFGDSSEQNRSWEDSGTTISGIYGTHQNSIVVRMPVLIVVPRVNSKLGPFREKVI